MAGWISEFLGAWKSIYVGHSITMRRIVDKRIKRKPLPTLDYPHEKPQLAERFRGAPMVISYQGENDLKEGSCIACGLCVKACPVNCITVEKDKNKEAPVKVANWTINLTTCMVCGLCADACPTGALIMSHDYENAEYKKERLIYDRERVLRRPIRVQTRVTPALEE